ncbi:MAG: hypothetical protein Q4E35_07580 [Eubacteriales bacterium]|nr:hypothetical protein [Eubacteriales bacterium]
MSFLRLILFMISFFGYCLILFKYTENRNVVPAVVLSAIVLFITACGYLKIMFLGSCLIYYTGFIFFGIELILLGKKKKICEISDLTGMFFILAFSVALYFILKDRMLESYDDFSHWGIMAKSLLENQALPDSECTYIMFQSYPPATAIWIYYVSTWVENTEGIYLLANSLMSVILFSSAISISKDTKWYIKAAAAVLLFFSANCTVSFTNLWVDGILGQAGLAAGICILQTYDRKRSVFDKISCALILSLTLMIKHSGIFFYIIIIVLLYLLREEKLNKSNLAAFFKQEYICLILPLVFLVLWRIHVKIAFPYGLESKHSASLRYFYKIIINNLSGFKYIIPKVISWSLNQRYNFLFPAFIVMIIVSIVEIKEKKKCINTRILTWLIMSIAVYQLGEMIMYCISMPISEFLYLNGEDYFRYNSTLVIFICGLSIFFFQKAFLEGVIKRIWDNTVETLIITAFILTIIPSTLINSKIVEFAPQEKKKKFFSAREKIADIAERENLYGKDCFFYNCDADLKDGFVIRYELFSEKNIYFAGEIDEIEIKKELEQYDAIINFDTGYVFR